LTRLPKLDTQPLNGETLAAFLAREVRSPRIREVVEAVVRLTSYAHAPDRISAGAAIAQLVLGLNPGVRYLDGGWQSMVDSVAAAARAAGAELRSGVRVDRVEHDGRVRGLALESGESVAADAVILALGPEERARSSTPAATRSSRAPARAAWPCGPPAWTSGSRACPCPSAPSRSASIGRCTSRCIPPPPSSWRPKARRSCRSRAISPPTSSRDARSWRRSSSACSTSSSPAGARWW
jgi:hypothetical protein